MSLSVAPFVALGLEASGDREMSWPEVAAFVAMLVFFAFALRESRE